MARTFGLTTGSERGTPGYDVTSPFMSGIKENIASTVPLALTAMNLKMDEEKAQAILGVRKEELARQVEKTKQENVTNRLKALLPLYAESGDQRMGSEIDRVMRDNFGVGLPSVETPAPVTGPENMEDPGTISRFFVPQTDLDKKLTLKDAEYATREAILRQQLEGRNQAISLAAGLKKAGVGKGGGSAKGKNVTVYGPGGKSKSVFVPQGEDYEPEEGWTLTKPSAKAGSFRERMAGAGVPGASKSEANTGFVVGEVRTVNGKNYKYLGENKWQEQ